MFNGFQVMGIIKIGFGGGCHWCTEAVFQSLKGVIQVDQGYIASTNENETFSEAVIVSFNSDIISTATLIEVHLLTHKSTSNHSFRGVYRSAIYYFKEFEKDILQGIINKLQPDFEHKIITKVLLFQNFKDSREQIQNYYLKNPQKPFCQKYISPKLELIKEKYSKYSNL